MRKKNAMQKFGKRYEYTALMYACDTRNMELFDVLWKHPKTNRNSILQRTIRKEDYQMFKKILRLPNFDKNARDPSTGCTPLQMASRCGNEVIFASLWRNPSVKPKFSMENDGLVGDIARAGDVEMMSSLIYLENDIGESRRIRDRLRPSEKARNENFQLIKKKFIRLQRTVFLLAIYIYHRHIYCKT